MVIQYLQITEDTWVYNICQLLNIHWYTISTNYRRYIGIQYLPINEHTWVNSTNYRRYIGIQYLPFTEDTLVYNIDKLQKIYWYAMSAN